MDQKVVWDTQRGLVRVTSSGKRIPIGGSVHSVSGTAAAGAAGVAGPAGADGADFGADGLPVEVESDQLVGELEALMEQIERLTRLLSLAHGVEVPDGE